MEKPQICLHVLLGADDNCSRSRFLDIHHDRVASGINGMLSSSGVVHGNVQRRGIIRVKNLIHGGVGICRRFVAEELDAPSDDCIIA